MKNTTTSFSLPATLLAQAHARAEENCQSLAEYLRQLILKDLASAGENNER